MNYYNEFDPKAAAWLRELIKQGHIPMGEVDTRSIIEVKPNELSKFNQCHFFAGIGGWSYALSLAGWPEERQVWTGSCPCQPFSCAGSGHAFEDTRHLWPEFFRLISACKPPTVFGEQVASKAGRDWLSIVFHDLEKVAYQRAAADLCASGVGAPHIRQRLWWVAYTERDEQSREEPCGWEAGRMGGIIKSVPWDRTWRSALCEFRTLDDGLSYGVGASDGARNAIVPQVASEFIQAFCEAREQLSV